MNHTVEQWLAAGPGAVQPGRAPEWLGPVVRYFAAVDPATLSEADPPATGSNPKQAAVLIVVGLTDDGTPCLTVERRTTHMRHHPGELCFPGGRREPEDADPVRTATREAWEELAVPPASTVPICLVPRLLVRATGVDITAVVAHQPDASDLVPDGTETESAWRVPLADFAQSAPWYTMRHPAGWTGQALDLPFGTLWGITADLARAVVRSLD